MPSAMVDVRNVLVSMMCLPLLVFCESHPAAVTPQTIADLNAGRWTTRRNAFERLAAVKQGIDRPRVQNLLINLREKENLESNKGQVDLFEDDDYLAYDQELTSLIQKIATATNNPQSWKALVNGRYNGDSEFGNWIASHRETLPFLIRQLDSPYPVRRMTAVYVVASMLAKAKSAEPFPPAEYQVLKRRIRAAAARGHPAVRQSAMKGLALTRDAEDAPFLEKLAKASADPDMKQFASSAAKHIRDSDP